ncbi:LysR family transcriptional regulator [Photorhabdus luminescens]|uniref:LysR family transcriptional regulator n=1 Tax=Photorhabdus akhurstii TaxID=171438 RepID=A0ABX8LUZ2_9GAMM|nr:LysR family transcriptional regulator [Photorhabdus akhurstii]UJD74469.1 LysR family transcriptional regulator [Photorhabdus luminescens]
MDKLRAISVFRRVVELGSFKAAAQDLGLSKDVSDSKNFRITYGMQFADTKVTIITSRYRKLQYY